MTGQTKHINGLMNNMNDKNRCIEILRALLKQENCRGEVSFAYIEKAIKELLDVKDASSDVNDSFIQHLEHASSVVSTWLKWKQEILGGTAMQKKEFLFTIMISKIKDLLAKEFKENFDYDGERYGWGDCDFAYESGLECGKQSIMDEIKKIIDSKE